MDHIEQRLLACLDPKAAAGWLGDFLAVLTALAELGINTTSLLASLGILGLLELIEGDERCSEGPGSGMVVKAINDDNVEVEFRMWLEDEEAHISERFELGERIFEAMRSAGVAMPYETFQLAPMEVQPRRRVHRFLSTGRPVRPAGTPRAGGRAGVLHEDCAVSHE